jgi:hypothetical protein
MEFRQLTTETARSVFIDRVELARRAHGKDFRSSSRSRIANLDRLEASKLYGLFKSAAADAEQMIAGIAMHDLESFPQSCPEPDLSHLPPRLVVECSDHWSLSGGAGMLAWAGLAVPMQLLGIKAVIAYLAAGLNESDHAGFYTSMGFIPAGPIVAHPFVETASGGHQLVQPVVLLGDALDNVIHAFAQACTSFSLDTYIFHLKQRVRPLVRHACAHPRQIKIPMHIVHPLRISAAIQEA